MAKKTRDVDSDDDGNYLAPLPADSPVHQIKHLLAWGRQRGFAFGPRIQLGDMIVEFRDLRLSDKTPRITEDDVWKAHGHDKGDE